MRFVNPNDVLHYPDNDASIYDLPQEDDDAPWNEVPDKPVKKSKKRPSAQAKQGRAVSLGAVWNYTDEENIVFEVEESQEVVATSKPAKRAKSAPAKKTKTKKAPYKVQNLESGESDVVDALDEEESNSQLTTPPDSTKGKTKKGRSAISKNKKGRLPSFKNLTITKAIEPQDKESVETPSAVISYQGWTSTQDAVKYNGLTQTTLDKLAAFRYHPTPSKPIFYESQTREQVEDIELAPVSMAFNGSDVLGNGGVSAQAADDPFVTEPAPEHPQHENILAEHDQEMEASYHAEAVEEAPPISNIEHAVVGLDEDVLPPSTACEPQTTDSDEAYQHPKPTSSEAPVPNHAKNAVHVDNENIESQRDLSIISSVVPEVRNFIEEQVVQNSGENAIEVNACSDGKTAPEISADTEMDEFDDGLDDDDLMAIAYDELALNEPMAAVQPAAIKLSPSMGIAHANLNVLNVPHLPLVNMDSDDDEYPMDAGEDDRMLGLCGYPDLVVEKHHAPSSLQNEIEFQEEYDSSLQFSPPPPPGAKHQPSANHHSDPLSPSRVPGNNSQDDFEDWAFMNTELDDVMRKAEVQKAPTTVILSQSHITGHFKAPKAPAPKVNPKTAALILDDSHEYYPLERFARPEFPGIVRDRCPIVGVSAQSFLRVCFRIGELFKEGARCNAAGQDAVIELFARVNFSSREAGTTKQHFRFMDLWSEHPPFPTGILSNFKTSSLADSESLFFVDDMGKGEMVRCLGRLKKEKKSDTGWIFDIINVRGTDWEEIRWTKIIVDAGAERGLSKL